MKPILQMATLVLATAVASPAAIVVFTGNLGPEVEGSSGFGSAMVTYDSDAHTLEVNFDWNNLTGTTTVAHIHCCVDFPGTVGVATYPGTFPEFPAGTTLGTYSSPDPIDLTDPASFTAGFLNNFGGGTVGGAEAALLEGLMSGRAYLNVHSSFAPGGEIRDFLAPVPEPGTTVLMAVPFALLAAYRFRKRAA